MLTSTANIVVYGGSMGAGKTYNGLLKHLKWADNPHYRGLVIRKNSSTIMKSGFLFDEAKGIYTNFDPAVKVKYKAQKFEFPSGAEIVFTHCATDDDAEGFKGGQFSFIMCDESTELQLNHVLRLYSRIRSKAGIPPQMLLTCNPSPDSFLRQWVDWYLLPEGHEHAGRPDPEKDGKIRWFVRVGDDMCWGDSREELVEKYGESHLSLDDDEQIKPISFQFLPATIYDNPPLIKLNPNYLANLKSLPSVQKERDLYGNWNIRESTAELFKREWCPIVHSDSGLDIVKICRAYDLASTLPSQTNSSPDYTASVKMAKLRSGDYIILDVKRHRIRVGDWLDFILAQAEEDGHHVDIILPEDPNAAAKAGLQQVLLRPINEAGFYATSKKTNRSKLDRFRPFAGAAQSGVIQILNNCGSDLWNNIKNDNSFWLKELEAFTGERKRGESGHDDVVDVCSDTFMYLAQSVSIPSGMLGGLKSFNTASRSPLLNIN